MIELFNGKLQHSPDYRDEESIIVDTAENSGTGGIYELGEQWTDEFEELNKGREWDGEFFDELEAFLFRKNKNDDAQTATR